MKVEEKKVSNRQTSFALLKSKEYIDYIRQEKLFATFSKELETFLLDYFKSSNTSPIECKLAIFQFFGEDYSEPMIKIKYPDSSDFDNLKIKDDIEEKFKLFLVNTSKDADQFRDYRQIQKKFRFVIRRE